MVVLASVSVVIGGGIFVHQAQKSENSKKTKLKEVNNQVSKKKLSNSQQVHFLPKSKSDKEIEVKNDSPITTPKTNNEEPLIPQGNSQNTVEPTPKEEESPQEKKREEPEKPDQIPPTQPCPKPDEKKKSEEKIKISKIQIPRTKWLETDDQQKINELICDSIYGYGYSSFEQMTKKGIEIKPPGDYWGNFTDGKETKDLKKLEEWVDETKGWAKKNEIIFVFVNVDRVHHSLLVYKKSDNLWRHYDSLGSFNFNTVKARTINNENLQNIPCPRQPDGWSCGTYPPIFFSILLKRYNNRQLNNSDDWKISDEEFRTERAKFIDII